jgi:hypothetical protein
MLTETHVMIIGVVVIGYCFWFTGPWSSDRQYAENWKQLWAFQGVMFALIVWARWPLAFYGLFGLGVVGYWIGKAVISQAHSDIRPDESDTRRRLYTATQWVVSLGIIWLIGWLLGWDWSEFGRT